MEINLDLVGRTLDRIIANPLEWDQEAFCGTTFCFAGHALLAEGWPVNEWGNFVDEEGDQIRSVEQTARQALGMTENMTDRIFYYFPRDEDDFPRDEDDATQSRALRLMINRVAEVTGIDPAPYLVKAADIP